MFQLAYTFAAIQKHIPGFRHNDLSWKNVRLTMPEGTVYKRKYGGRKLHPLEYCP